MQIPKYKQVILSHYITIQCGLIYTQLFIIIYNHLPMCINPLVAINTLNDTTLPNINKFEIFKKYCQND